MDVSKYNVDETFIAQWDNEVNLIQKIFDKLSQNGEIRN